MIKYRNMGICLLLPSLFHTLVFRQIINLSQSTKEDDLSWKKKFEIVWLLNEKKTDFYLQRNSFCCDKRVSFLKHEMLYSPVIIMCFSSKWNCPNQSFKVSKSYSSVKMWFFFCLKEEIFKNLTKNVSVHYPVQKWTHL